MGSGRLGSLESFHLGLRVLQASEPVRLPAAVALLAARTGAVARGPSYSPREGERLVTGQALSTLDRGASLLLLGLAGITDAICCRVFSSNGEVVEKVRVIRD